MCFKVYTRYIIYIYTPIYPRCLVPLRGRKYKEIFRINMSTNRSRMTSVYSSSVYSSSVYSSRRRVNPCPWATARPSRVSRLVCMSRCTRGALSKKSLPRRPRTYLVRIKSNVALFVHMAATTASKGPFALTVRLLYVHSM